MNLSESEIHLFYRLWYGLIWGINEKHKVIPRFKKPVYGTHVTVPIEDFVKIRNAMWDNPAWIDEFLSDHDYGEYTEQERGIILDWRKHFIKGKFLVMKHLAKYSVLMTFESKPALLYGVCGISDPIKDTFANPVPFPAEFVLLPFKGKIIYDSLVSMFNITFGPSIRSSAREWYGEAKDMFGIIEALGDNASGPKSPSENRNKETSKAAAVAPDKTIAVPKEARVPKAMVARYLEVATIIERFCDERLTTEYKEICLRALAKLCRKRPSPLVSGKANTWACGIVYAIGSSNFIFDKSQPVHRTATEIAGWFGLAKSTAGNKASEIAGLLDLSYMNTEFMLKSFIDNNPAIWLLSVNGYIMDIRDAPYEAQVEAFRRGLIPYIPADEKKPGKSMRGSVVFDVVCCYGSKSSAAPLNFAPMHTPLNNSTITRNKWNCIKSGEQPHHTRLDSNLYNATCTKRPLTPRKARFLHVFVQLDDIQARQTKSNGNHILTRETLSLHGNE